MLRKVISVFVGLVLLLFSVIPANAAEAANVKKSIQTEKELAEIDTLISLASSAAQAGKMEAAHTYEEMIKDYGVEVVASDNVQQALVALGMDDAAVASTYDVDLPENTSAVHWYKYSAPNYYNYRTGGNYDLICITASSFDGTHPLLRYSSVSYGNKQHKTYTQSVIDSAVAELVRYGIEETIDGAGLLLTVADIARKAQEESRVFSTVEIPTNGLTVVFSAERTIRFWYARSTGSGTGYGLWYVEDKVLADISCTLVFDFKDASGKSTADMIQKMVLDAEIKQPTYGDMTRPCDACKRRVFTENAVGDMCISLMDETVVVDGKGLPDHPIALQ